MKDVVEGMIAALMVLGLSYGSNAQEIDCLEANCEVFGFGNLERALWVPNLPNGVDDRFAFDEDGGTLIIYPDGSAQITGHCVNLFTPGYGFYMDFRFEPGMNWDAWSSLGRSWKGNSSIVGNLFETWDYFIMDPDYNNVLIGSGNYEGSVLHVTHNPEDYFYGLQIGEAANDKNGEHGLSFWFNYSGTLNGEPISGHGDINLEGGCNEVPALDCPVDITVDCEEGNYLPELTGSPELNCQEPLSLSYSDEVSGDSCELLVVRTWTITNAFGDSMSCEQSIQVQDLTAPEIAPMPELIEACDLETLVNQLVIDNCDENPSISIAYANEETIQGSDCDLGQLRTQTIGGWGSPANGNNPGAYRDAHFDAAFPNGLTVGCENTLSLTSAEAVQAFLPSGGSPSILPAGSMVDPGGVYSNNFAAQLVGATLSVGFDAYDPEFGPSDFSLAEAVYLNGAMAGLTVAQVLDYANLAIGGCESPFSVSELHGALTTLNENYVDGTQNNGQFGCGNDFDCALGVTVTITAVDACGNTNSLEQNLLLTGEGSIEISEIPETITVECGEIPEAFIEVNAGCFTPFVEVSVDESSFSGACQPTIQRTYTVSIPCAEPFIFTQYIVVVDQTAPVFADFPSQLTIDCGDEMPPFNPEVYDLCGISQIVESEEVVPLSCGQMIVRSLTATDLCGNSTSISQHVIVEDTSAPLASDFDYELTLGCTDPLPSGPTFFDTCSEIASVVYEESAAQQVCGESITRVWTVADQCGNTSVFTQEVQRVDNQGPEFVFVPSDLEINCGSNPEYLDALAIDACSDVAISYSEVWVEGGETCGVLQRTWVAVDACGNQSTASALVNFVDNEAPVLLGLPDDGLASCEALSAQPEVSAVDNCSENVEVVFVQSETNVACQQTILRTWSATDACGNSSTHTQTIVINESAVPVIIGETNINTTCSALETATQVSVESLCETATSLSYSDEVISGSNPCSYTIVRTWEAANACGTSEPFVQTIQVSDDSAPVFSFVPDNLVLGCGESYETQTPIAEDLCSSFEIEVSESWSGDACSETLVRTFTATDACGNASTAVQTIQFIDNVAPMFTNVPSNQFIECTDPWPAQVDPQVSDNCNDLILSFEEHVVPGSCAGNYQLIRTWTATDACGNSSAVEQVIDVSDNIPPVFDVLPADLEANCGAIPQAEELTATDNCSEVVVTFEEFTDSGGCPNIYRVWTATDACGNSTSHTQTLVLIDNEPPVLVGIPPNTNASCNSLPPVPEPEVSDNCDDQVDVAYVETIVGSGCSYTLIRTWIASDDCGNTSVVSQSIVVEDTEAPVFVNVAPIQIVDCAALDGMPLPQVTDDCGNTVSIVFEDEVVGSGCSYTIFRTYTATDLCGNSTQASTQLNIEDLSAPVISGVGPNTSVQCGAVPAPSSASAIDACSGEVELVVTETQIGEGCSYILNRTYSATDACGNTSSQTQLIFVSDQEGPELLGLPENLYISCNDPLPAPPIVGAIDACDGVVDVQYSEVVEQTQCGETITRIWSAVDACGNERNSIRTVVRSDQDAPEFTFAPEDQLVQCGTIPPVVFPEAMDACSNVEISLTSETIEGGCPYQIVRTFAASDACGNIATHVQTLYVVDEEAPTLSDYPGDLTVGCGDLPEAPTVGAIDNCSGTTVYFEEEWGAPGCVQLLLRTWTAVDLCGNSSSHTQSIHIVDESAPGFEFLPEDLTVNCLQVPPMVALPVLDDCSQVQLAMDEFVQEGACPSEYNLTRVWTATDLCGNEQMAVQQIHVIDNIAPVLSPQPEDLRVACGEIPEAPNVQALDGCGELIDVVFTEQIIGEPQGSDSCFASNAQGFVDEIALWLPGVDGLGAFYVFGPEGGVFSEHPASGRASLSGIVYNTENANQAWIIDLELHEARDWASWSALGRSYKDDLGMAEEHFETWTYYVLDSENSGLIGSGDLAGSFLSLTHAPADTVYGFQLGMNANNHGEGYGLGGWFFYDGQIGGNQVGGHGDFFTLHNCCNAHEIIRVWTATDCAGNTSSWTQTITVDPNEGIEAFPLVFPDPEPLNFDVRGTESELFTLQFLPDESGQVRIELFNELGRRIDIVRELEVSKGLTYEFTYPKSRLSAGKYIFVLSAGDRIASDKELVIR